MSLVIGLMSGTSADGIDAALVEITGAEAPEAERSFSAEEALSVELKDFVTVTYQAETQQEILACSNEDTGRVGRICRLNFQLAGLFVEVIFQLLDQTGRQPEEIDLLASHGHTVYHDVQSRDIKSTLQIGTAALLAERTGITTVSNFRVRDMAAGGEGAPLVPYVDYLLYRGKDNRVLQNIGGIGNFTYLPAHCSQQGVVGTDTGPGNMLINEVVSLLSSGRLTFDRDGLWAARGSVSTALLNYLMDHPFIQKAAPKTTGREEFGAEYARQVIREGDKQGLSRYDITATVTAFSAYSMVDAYRRFIPGSIDQIIVGGGGSYNPVLLKMLESYTGQLLGDEIEVLTQEDLGYSSEAKEAIAFAVLGYQTMKGRPNNLPRVTGASKSVVLGEITPGMDFYKYLDW